VRLHEFQVSRFPRGLVWTLWLGRELVAIARENSPAETKVQSPQQAEAASTHSSASLIESHVNFLLNVAASREGRSQIQRFPDKVGATGELGGSNPTVAPPHPTNADPRRFSFDRVGY
jgi:hypothetical protein